jgi:NTE family protein
MNPGPSAERAPSRPPRLALVIGSGGVKSIAGLGVARALAAAGQRPELVVGSSAGAIFGAFIARGDGFDEAQRTATTLWSRELTSRHRMRSWVELGVPGLAGFDERFALRDDRLILERMQRAFGDIHLEELATPLAVVATCAASGSRVVIRRGRLVDALRATVALPFLFAPWPVEGRLLLDGSLCDPLPLGVAAEAGAQRTVAVGFDCPMPTRINRPGRLATRVISALTNNVMHAHIAAADPLRNHVMLLQPATRVGLFDTHRMAELVALGESQARAWIEAGMPVGRAAHGTAPCAPTLLQPVMA